MSWRSLLDDQAYRLSFWRVASDEINYRRFFDINDLAAIRVENPEVFATVHRIPFELIQKGAGIREFASTTPTACSTRSNIFEDLQAQAPLPGRRHQPLGQRRSPPFLRRRGKNSGQE